MTLPTPTTVPFNGAAGNTSDSIVTKAPGADLQNRMQIIMEAVSQTPAGDVATITNHDINHGAYTYGSPNDPMVVKTTDSSGLRLRGSTNFSGYGDSYDSEPVQSRGCLSRLEGDCDRSAPHGLLRRRRQR